MPFIQTNITDNARAGIFRKQRQTRDIWMMTRSFLETNTYKHKRYGGKSKSHWTLFERIIFLFGFFLKVAGLYQRGFHNAKNIVVNKIETCFPDLPEPFHGYKILHLSDLHLDCYEGIENILCQKNF